MMRVASLSINGVLMSAQKLIDDILEEQRHLVSVNGKSPKELHLKQSRWREVCKWSHDVLESNISEINQETGCMFSGMRVYFIPENHIVEWKMV